jgi:multidrug resistance protein, MATE family
MSSTYVHYSTTPSSLPSDYALLSRYAAVGSVAANTNINDTSAAAGGQDIQNDDDMLTYDIDDAELTPEARALLRRQNRRSSFPTAYVTPFNPTSMGPLPDDTGHRSGPVAPNATENTPLLAPLVPRIEEEVDDESSAASADNHRNMLWEEMRILSKYTLPVFGYFLFVFLKYFST